MIRSAAKGEPELDGVLEQYLEQHKARHLEDLMDFLRIESISTLRRCRADMQRAAAFLAQELRRIGLAGSMVHETAGHPVVLGRAPQRAGLPRILIYGHYDVQPEDPLPAWKTPPFSPTVQDGRIVARGVSDDKAPLWIAIKALEALMATAGELPLNVTVLLEGEEEIGSPSLRPFVEEHREMLQADVVVSADGAMWRPEEPSLTVSGKGLCGVEVTVRTAGIDLHSGRHGGGVPNALHVLCEMVARLHDHDGRVAVPGFYDGVLDPDADERARIAALPFDEDGYRTSLGIGRLSGEPGYGTLERQWLRPTLDLNGLYGGFLGEGSKTVIPCEATAKISCRLVPDQSPSEIRSLLEEHLRRIAPAEARLSFRPLGGDARAYAMPLDHPALAAARSVLSEVFAKAPLVVRMGGTLPCAEVFLETLGAHTLFFSFSTADEQFHAPNEFFRLERFDRGRLAFARLLQELPSAYQQHV